MSNEYDIHPAATLFPMMGENEYQSMKQDIAENGQQDPIIFWCDQILDGRNRLRACTELGVEPRFLELDKHSDPWKYVISHNLHRRHLTTSQRAAVAGKLATLKHGEAGNGRKVEGQNCTSTIDDAASALNVSARSVKSARKVQEEGSKAVQQAVEEGTLTVDLAAKLVTFFPDKAKQTELVRAGKAAVREAVRNKGEANNNKGDAANNKADPNPSSDKYSDHKVTASEINGMASKIRQWQKDLEKKKRLTGGQYIDIDPIIDKVDVLVRTVRDMAFFGECPACQGGGCKGCRKLGWISVGVSKK